MNIMNVSDASFQNDVLSNPKPVLVDFWAEWCGPCKAIAPALEELANKLADKVTVAKLDIDRNPQTTRGFGVRGVPTLMIFKNGQVAGTRVGLTTAAKLREWVESVI